MRYHKEKWSGLGKKAVSVLLCASMIVPFGQGITLDARAAGKDPVYFESSRLPADSLPDGDCIYFGTAAATVEEKGEYAVRIYREGNVNKAASVEVKTIDMTAVYGEDYELVMDGVEETGDGTTLLEKYVDGKLLKENAVDLPFSYDSDGNPVFSVSDGSPAGMGSSSQPEVSSEENGETASRVSTLAAKKEAQTGEDTRELKETEDESLAEAMSDAFMSDTMENIDSSSKCKITFEKGDRFKDVRFRILEDEKSEGTEGFSLLLANAEGAEVYKVVTCAISIEDDEKEVRSEVSFTEPKYQAKDGKVVLTVKRTGAEYSICDMVVRTSEDTAHAGVNYEAKNETLAFAPYETEKEIEMDVAGEGRFSVMLMDLKACTEGKNVKTVVEISGDTGKKNSVAAGLKGAAKANALSFDISINNKAYTVEYTMGNATGKIMDYGYTPALEVGTYYFSSDKSHGGIFNYGYKEGSKPWGCGKWKSEYYFDGKTSTTMDNHYGELNYYHTTSSKKGRTYAKSDAVIPGVYYQYFVPDWESTSTFGGGQRVRLTMFKGSSTWIGDASHDGQFGRSQNYGLVMNKGNNGNLSAKAESCDEYGSKTPQSFVKYYGLCSLYRKFEVSVEPAATLKYMTGTEDSYVDTEPVQVTVKCGAQEWSNRSARNIYANQDENQSNLQFSVGDTHVNGTSGKFGQITGFQIKLDPGDPDKQVIKNYPGDFKNWLEGKIGSTGTTANFSSNNVKKEIAKVKGKMDRIPFDAYFLQWISEIQKDVKTDGSGYKQVLKFKPIIEYYPVEVHVEKSKYGSGKFSKVKLEAGKTYEYHAGDSLNLEGVSDSDNYTCVGYDVSTDGGKKYNTIRDGSNLLLEPFKKYRIRPVMMTGNKVEIKFANYDALSRFEVSGLIDQSLLDEADKDKYILDLNPEQKKAEAKMKPSPNKDYVLNITVRDGRGSDSSYVYRPTVKFRTASTEYTTQYFPFTAAAEQEDNVIEIGVSKVLKSELKQYTVKGTLLSAFPPIRSDGLGLTKLPVSNYTLSIGKGGQIKDKNGLDLVDTACTTPGQDGVYELLGISGVEGDVIPMLMTDGVTDGQITNVRLTGRTRSSNGEYQVNLGDTLVTYPYNTPKVTDITYSYDNDNNNNKSDNTQNSIKIEDDTLNITAKVNPYGDKIKEAIFTVYTVTGQTDEYRVTESPENKNTFVCKIPKMLENLHNADRIKVRLVSNKTYKVNVGQNGDYDDKGNFVLDDVKDNEGNTITGGAFQIEYPDVDTGLAFYVENEEIVPQSFEVKKSTAANIPLLGSAMGSADSGLLTFGKTWWDNNKSGYTIQVGVDGSFGTVAVPTTKQKKEAYNRFHGLAKEARKLKKDSSAEMLICDMYGKASGSGEYKEEELEKEMMSAENALKAIKKDKSSKAKKSMAQMNKSAWNVEIAFVLAFDFIYNPERNEYMFACGSVAVGGTYAFNKTAYTMISTVPAFVNFALTMQANLVVAYSTDDGREALTAGDFESYSGNIAERLGDPHSTLSLMFSGKAQAGVGLCGILSARGYVTLKVQFDIGLTDSSPSGALIGSTGGIGVDLFIFSIDVNLYSVTKGWGSLEGRTNYNFFGGLLAVNSKKAKKKSAALDTGIDREADVVLKEYEDGETLTMHNYASGTSDMGSFGKNGGRKKATLEMVSVNTLLDNAAEHTRPKMIPLDDGKKMVTFIGNRGGSETNSTALYYAVYDGLAWSMPAIIAEDTTVDSTPDVLKAGNKVIIAWADADRKFTEEDNFADKLNTMGISVAVYDIDTGIMGQEVTLVQDEYFNFAPQINIDDTNIYVSYMKRDLSTVKVEEDLLDLTKVYSTMAYTTYDYQTNTMQDEKLIQISHDNLSDPLVMDYTSSTAQINGETYLVSTYTIDEDTNLKSDTDRELYLSIYNIDQQKEYYPIRMTNDGISQSSPKLTDINGNLYFTWLADGYIFNITNVSEMLEAMFDTSKAEETLDEDGGKEQITVDKDVYINSDPQNADWYKKNAADLNMDEERYKGSIYEDLAKGDFRVDSANIAEHEDMMTSLSAYTLTTNGKDIYIFYTDFGAEVESSGVEIYGVRYKRGLEEKNESDDVGVSEESGWGFGKAVQITNKHKVIDELDLYMDEDNKVSAVSNYFDQWIDENGAIQYGSNKLVEIEFDTVGSIEVKDDHITLPTRFVGGEIDHISFEAVNNGLLTSKGFDYTVSQIAGGTETVIDTGHLDVALDAGESTEVVVPWTIPENLSDTSIKVTVTETGVSNVKTTEVVCNVPYEAKFEFSDTDVLWNEDQPYVSTVVTNIGNAPSAETNAALSSLDKEGNALKNYGEAAIPALAAGEEKVLEIPFTPGVEDFDDLGTINLLLEASDGTDTVQTYAKLSSSVPLCAQIGDGSDMKLKSGDTAVLETKAAPWNSIAGEIWYYSSNPEVVSVNENGVLTGRNNGTATIYAYYVNTGLKTSVDVKVSGADSSGGSSSVIPSQSSAPLPTVTPSPAATATPVPADTPSPAVTPTPTPDIPTEETAGTKEILPKKKSLVIAPGKSASIAYSAVVDVPVAVKASDVTVSVSGNKHVSAKLKDSKVQITANKKAVRGSAASVALKSTNAEGKTVKAVIKVKVQNKAKKLSTKKKSFTVRKGSKKKLTITIKAQNNKKATTDKVKVSSGIVSLTKSSVKKKKVTLTLKGKKKSTKNVTIYVGSKKIKVKVKVR